MEDRLTLHIKQPGPASIQFQPPTEPSDATDPARDLSQLFIRARLRPVQARAAGEAGLLDTWEGEAVNEDWYWFTAEVSSMALDAYFTHMTDSTLRNFAREGSEGVALLDSHDGYKLGVGYSAGGRYEEEDGNGRALVVFYIVPGIRFGGKHSFASSDDYIRAIESGVVRDVSASFYGGRWVCDLCHQPYYGRDTTCNHIAGWEYEIERDGKMEHVVCTVAISDAHLSEVSLVYDGATPGAMILKAEQEAEAGRLSPEMVRQIERRYRVKLPVRRGQELALAGMMDSVIGVRTTSASAANFTISAEVEVDGERAMEDEIVETVEEQAVDAAETEQARAMLAEIRQVVTESTAPKGTTLVAAVRWLNEQLAQTIGDRDRALAQVAELQPLADQGRAYREELISQAVAEGVRAIGETFPEETYRAMLANAPLEHIRQVRDTFAEQAKVRFPGGRQTRDADEEDGKPQKRAIPAAAYGVKG